MKLIDADALLKQIAEDSRRNEGWYGDTWGFINTIKDAPTIDAVPVVRCGECKYLAPGGICETFADDMIEPSASDYCSYGERRTDGR